MKRLKYFVLVMSLHASAFAGENPDASTEPARTKRPRANSDLGSLEEMPSELAGGLRKIYKIRRKVDDERNNRPGFMTLFPTMNGVSLGIEGIFQQFSIGTSG